MDDYEHYFMDEFYDFPSIGKNNPQLLFTPSFFRGVGLNHQPDTLREIPYE